MLYLSPSHISSFKAKIDLQINNFYELVALKPVLMLAQEKGVTQIQVLGDSLLVI